MAKRTSDLDKVLGALGRAVFGKPAKAKRSTGRRSKAKTTPWKVRVREAQTSRVKARTLKVQADAKHASAVRREAAVVARARQATAKWEAGQRTAADRAATSRTGGPARGGRPGPGPTRAPAGRPSGRVCGVRTLEDGTPCQRRGECPPGTHVAGRPPGPPSGLPSQVETDLWWWTR